LTKGDRPESASGLTLTLSNFLVPLEEKYHPQVQSLLSEIALADSGLLRKGGINIQQDAISYTLHGVLKNVAATRQILSLLTQVAERIESEPVN